MPPPLKANAQQRVAMPALAQSTKADTGQGTYSTMPCKGEGSNERRVRFAAERRKLITQTTDGH